MYTDIQSIALVILACTAVFYLACWIVRRIDDTGGF